MRSLTVLLALAALLLGTGSPSPDAIGLGIVTIPVERGQRIVFVADSGSDDAVLAMELVADTVAQSIGLAPTAPSWFQPETFWPDYSLFTFRVINETPGALEVVVDSESGRTLWLQRDPGFEFKPWAQFLVENVTNFDRIDARYNPLRVAPDAGAQEIAHDGRDCLAVVEVQGEWARVRTSDLCAMPGTDVEPVEDAWVRWRSDSHLLITYGMTC